MKSSQKKEVSNYSEEEIKALQNMVDVSLDMICSVDREGRFFQVSKSCNKILGYTQEELIGEHFIQFVHPEDRAHTEKKHLEIRKGFLINGFENRYVHKRGMNVPLSWSAHVDEGTSLIFCVAKEAAELKQLAAENELERQNKEILLNITDRLIWSFDKKINLIEANQSFFEAVKQLSGVSLQKGDNLIDENLFSGKIQLQPWIELYRTVLSGEAVEREFEMLSESSGEKVWVRTELKPITKNGEVVGGVCQAIDINIKKIAEKQIEELNIRLKEAQKIAKLGYWELNLQNENIYWSDEVYSIWEIEDRSIKPNFALFFSSIHPEDQKEFLIRHNEAISEASPLLFEHRIKLKNGTVKWVLEQGNIVKDASNNTTSFKGTVQDITKQKIAEQELKELNAELKRRAFEVEQINKELEQFAFAASHDLQEPLRMVTSFMGKLQNKYAAHLDEKANTYIWYAIDGANRMRHIIKDLLAYSRAGNIESVIETLDVNQVIEEAVKLYRNLIVEKNAVINSEKLPSVVFSKAGLNQVFQNLIGNALKYCEMNKAPKIDIGFQEDEMFYEFIIKDNGIGIKEEFLEKIFNIFQRLHTRNEFSGSGLGLGICKKIIEKGGGQIWAESVYGQGSQFHFTIPKLTIQK